jgi:hypothetical protein
MRGRSGRAPEPAKCLADLALEAEVLNSLNLNYQSPRGNLLPAGPKFTVLNHFAAMLLRYHRFHNTGIIYRDTNIREHRINEAPNGEPQRDLSKARKCDFGCVDLPPDT